MLKFDDDFVFELLLSAPEIPRDSSISAISLLVNAVRGCLRGGGGVDCVTRVRCLEVAYHRRSARVRGAARRSTPNTTPMAVATCHPNISSFSFPPLSNENCALFCLPSA